VLTAKVDVRADAVLHSDGYAVAAKHPVRVSDSIPVLVIAAGDIFIFSAEAVEEKAENAEPWFIASPDATPAPQSTSAPRKPTPSSPPGPEPGVEAVDNPQLLKILNSSDMVFFTLRTHPISRLADKLAQSEFASSGPGPNFSVQQLMALQTLFTGHLAVSI